MAKKIKTVQDLIESERWKKATKNKQFTEDEIDEIEKLFYHIQEKYSLGNSRVYDRMTDLAYYDCFNLIERFDYLTENSRKRTIETFLVRYGETEGKARWDEYIGKQRRANSFEHYQEKGWTREEYDRLVESRTITKENMIKKYGEEEGIRRWEEYRLKQSYSNTLEYFQEKYGEEEGLAKWQEYNKAKGNHRKKETE